MAFVLASTGGRTAAAFRAATEELEIFANDLHAAALLATGFVFPSVHAQAAFDIEWAAFFGVFAGDFGEAAPELDIDEGGFLTLFAGCSCG